MPAPEGMKLRLCLESLVGIPARGDERSQDQRQADALIELCSVAIGSGKLPRQAGRRPQLTVIVRTQAGGFQQGFGAVHVVGHHDEVGSREPTRGGRGSERVDGFPEPALSKQHFSLQQERWRIIVL